MVFIFIVFEKAPWKRDQNHDTVSTALKHGNQKCNGSVSWHFSNAVDICLCTNVPIPYFTLVWNMLLMTTTSFVGVFELLMLPMMISWLMLLPNRFRALVFVCLLPRLVSPLRSFILRENVRILFILGYRYIRISYVYIRIS